MHGYMRLFSHCNVPTNCDKKSHIDCKWNSKWGQWINVRNMCDAHIDYNVEPIGNY